MKIKEAIFVLKLIDTDNNGIVRESLNIAIRSLEAWEKVLEEMGDVNMDIYTDEVKEIIKKHLGEVEE